MYDATPIIAIIIFSICIKQLEWYSLEKMEEKHDFGKKEKRDQK